MGFLGGVAGAIGANQARKYAGYDPKYTQEYENKRLGDIRSLYTDEAYKGPGIGLSEEDKRASLADIRSRSRGAGIAERQALADRYRSSGGQGLRSGSYDRQLQRSRLAEAERENRAATTLNVQNIQQSRADKLARLAAVTGAFETNVGIFNQRQANLRDLTLRQWEGIGQAGDAATKAAMMGVAG